MIKWQGFTQEQFDRWAAWAKQTHDDIMTAYAQLAEVLIRGLDEALVTLDEFFNSDFGRELMAQLNQPPVEESALDRARRISREDVRRKRHDQRRGG